MRFGKGASEGLTMGQQMRHDEMYEDETGCLLVGMLECYSRWCGC